MKVKINEKRPLEIVDAPMYGQVGAGSVIPFTARDGQTVQVAVPHGMHGKDLGTAEVCGPSLEDRGVYTGDILLFNTRFTKRAAMFQVCIVHIHSTGETIAKRVVPGGDGFVILRASGGGVADLKYHADDVEIKGIVVGFQRPWQNVDLEEFGF